MLLEQERSLTQRDTLEVRGVARLEPRPLVVSIAQRSQADDLAIEARGGLDVIDDKDDLSETGAEHISLPAYPVHHPGLEVARSSSHKPNELQIPEKLPQLFSVRPDSMGLRDFGLSHPADMHAGYRVGGTPPNPSLNTSCADGASPYWPVSLLLAFPEHRLVREDQVGDQQRDGEGPPLEHIAEVGAVIEGGRAFGAR